jgi:hypothetical protein
MHRITDRSPSRGLALQLLLATIAMLLFVVISHVTHSHAGALSAAAPLMLGDIRQFGKRYQTLASLVKPQDANLPESIPFVLFDTQQYPQAGAASLTFFNNATAANASDPTLSNFANGQLDDGYYFEIHRMHMMIAAIPNLNVTAVITGAASDVEILHKTARGIFGLRIKGKTYGDYPLAYYGRPGGPVPIYSSFGTGTAANNAITAGETESNGGFPVLGNIIIQPTNVVKGIMTFNSTAISAATNITVALMGVLHRPLA